MYLGDEISVSQNVNGSQQSDVLQSHAGHGIEVQQGYPDPNVMTSLIRDASQPESISTFGAHPLDQRDSGVRHNEMPVEQQISLPEGLMKAKSGHRSGHCQYCHKWFHRLSLHKCKLSPEFNHRATVGTKRKAQPTESQMRGAMQFKVRQEEFVAELQQLVCRGHVELGLEMHVQMFYNNRVLFHEFRTPQLNTVTSVIGEPLVTSLSQDLASINSLDGVKDGVSKVGWDGLHENSQLASGSPIGNPNMTPQKYPSREISEKTNAKLMVGGNDGGICKAAELILRDGNKKVKKGTHSLRLVENEHTGQAKWLRCPYCPKSRYSVHGGKTPYVCESCDSFYHPDCFMEYHKASNLPLSSTLLRTNDIVD